MLISSEEWPVSIEPELLEIPAATGRLLHMQDVKLTVWS